MDALLVECSEGGMHKRTFNACQGPRRLCCFTFDLKTAPHVRRFACSKCLSCQHLTLVLCCCSHELRRVCKQCACQVTGPGPNACMAHCDCAHLLLFLCLQEVSKTTTRCASAE